MARTRASTAHGGTFFVATPPQALHKLGESFLLTADGAREAMRRRTMFYAIHKDALVNVGFGVRREETFRVEEFGRRRRVTLDGHEMWMVSPEDLILPKLVWGQASNSDVQARDVRAVIAAQTANLDWTYLTTWADALGVSDALRVQSARHRRRRTARAGLPAYLPRGRHARRARPHRRVHSAARVIRATRLRLS